MYQSLVVAVVVVWPTLLVAACLLVRGGAIHEREMRHLSDAQRKIQRALAH